MYITVNGYSLAYTDSGKGTPLVLIHGYPLSRKIWQPQAADLSDTARVLAPDLRGHGDSQAVPGSYSVDLLAADIKAFLEFLKIQEKIVLGGLSMGGYIVFAFLRNYPELVKGLILTATRAAADSPQAKAAREQTATLAQQQGVQAVAQGMLPKMFAPVTLESKPGLVNQLKEIMEHTSLEGVTGDLAAMKDRPDSTPDLGAIQVPTLVIHGAQDAIVPLEEARAMQRAIPGATLQVIENAGHLPNLENEPAYNQAVRKFLAQF